MLQMSYTRRKPIEEMNSAEYLLHLAELHALDVPETDVGSKTAATRLLDLLAGWSAHVSADEESGLYDPSLPAEEIGELYQMAGAISESWELLDVDDRENAVATFVRERVLPLLLR